MPQTITFPDFERVDIRTGTIMEARPFPEGASPHPSRKVA
jgi:tRNA-binding protein